MARLQSQVKIGTYPLEEFRADQIIKLIKNRQPGSGRIFDPFCDTGHIVNRLADAWGLEAYCSFGAASLNEKLTFRWFFDENC